MESLVINSVAIEKLAHDKFAEVASRQEDLHAIIPNLPDIFDHSNFHLF